jgi:hypothetical protein
MALRLVFRSVIKGAVLISFNHDIGTHDMDRTEWHQEANPNQEHRMHAWQHWEIYNPQCGDLPLGTGERTSPVEIEIAQSLMATPH